MLVEEVVELGDMEGINRKSATIALTEHPYRLKIRPFHPLVGLGG